jgi:heptosyltransferase-2
MLDSGRRGLARAVRAVRRERFDQALSLPNSFRSALIPFLAGIPERRGAPGHWRRALLNVVLHGTPDPERPHQSWEAAWLLVPGYRGASLPAPRLDIPPERADAVRAAYGLDGAWAALMPGAARGPSKQWPAERYAEVGQRLVRDAGMRIAVLGSLREAPLCRRVAECIGPASRAIVGASIPDWAAMLSMVRVAVGNDSGGAHLSAAVGTPVVVVCGITDPAVTGPLGEAVRIVQDSDMRRRDVPRDSDRARKSLERVSADAVYDAVREMSGDEGRGPRANAR